MVNCVECLRNQSKRRQQGHQNLDKERYHKKKVRVVLYKIFQEESHADYHAINLYSGQVIHLECIFQKLLI